MRSVCIFISQKKNCLINFLLIVAGNVDILSMHLNISAESSVNCLLKCKKKTEREREEENETNDMETSSPMPNLSLIFVCATQRK